MRKLTLLFALILILSISFARGGGGCFLAGTLVQTLSGTVPIDHLDIGDQVLSFEDGVMQTSEVLDVHQVERDYFYTIRTTDSEVNATAEHPFYTNQGYVTVENLKQGDSIYLLENNSLSKEEIISISLVNQKTEAYNLQVSDPHTFFANDFAVHNKGGGGGGGGGGGHSSSHSSSHGSSGGGSGDGCGCLIFLLLILLIIFSMSKRKEGRTGGEWSSTIEVSKKSVMDKAKKTSVLLSQWTKVWPRWNEKTMKDVATSTFLKLQECWEKRDYTEMQPLMMPELYEDHVAQLESMKTRHEINKLEKLKLLDMQVVLVKKYENTKKDEFTVWLQAKARDVIIDDRTGKKIRGDESIGQFEEFWSFKSNGKNWLLEEITQPEEGGGILKEENFHEMETPGMMDRAYEKAGKGPAIKDIDAKAVREQEEGAATATMGTIKWKGGRVHRLLNFLVESDKIWDAEKMKSTARSLFILLNTSIEQKKLDKVIDKITPDLFQVLQSNVRSMIEAKQRVEKRNLAVRDVEIVLVRNFYDRSKDEFTAWVSGQAQSVVVDEKSERIISGDSYVADFEEFWIFQRNGDVWLLKSIDEGFKAKQFVDQENIDEGTSNEMLQWYYTKDRTV